MSAWLALAAPPRAPELNGQENILAIHVAELTLEPNFQSLDDIVDHYCYAWNRLIDQPWKIMSIARRDWVAERQGREAPRPVLANPEAAAPRTLESGPGGRRRNSRPCGAPARRRFLIQNITILWNVL
jgi:hypothetical protein